MTQRAWRLLQLYIFAMLAVLACSPATAREQDTLVLSMPEAEKIFLQNNLTLLAAKYNVDANMALIKQARLWDNPVISTDQNIYDRQGGFFKHDQTNGQIYVQLMQLIKTAGKRNKLAALANDNTTLAAGTLEDLLRTLRYTLLGDMLEIEHQLKIRRVYMGEISELQILAEGMDKQLQSGNISVKDNIRIKALLFSLQNELVNVDAALMPLQSEVKLLLNKSDSSFIMPSFTYYLPDLINKELPARQALLDIASANRPDAKIAHAQLAYARDNFTYQKALAKPDISIGSEYDQHSSYAPDYVGLAIGFPLNIFNRNQGNISSAKFGIQQQQVLLDAQGAKIENDISAVITKVKYYQRVNNLQQLDFAQQYEAVFQNMLQSYRQRQVSLLEFIDFADAYKDTRLKILEQHTALIKALAELNYESGRDVISLK
jgi:outer membrane protein, heavy metal efflux system